MVLSTLRIDYPSPAVALIYQLGQALAQGQGQSSVAVSPVPLYQTGVGEWRSSWILANARPGSGTQEGQTLLRHLSRQPAASGRGGPSWLGWEFWLQSPGWIYARLPPWALARCLQQLAATVPQSSLLGPRPAAASQPWPSSPAPERDNPDLPDRELGLSSTLERLQYAHARCCTLLRLGADTGCLALAFEDGYPRVPNPLPSLPWLDPQRHLWFAEPAEVALLRTLLHFPAGLQRQHHYFPTLEPTQVVLSWPPSKYLGQYLDQLAEQIVTFEQRCNIFGVVKHHQPERATARLGLILILQGVLAFVLRSLLASEAPADG